MTIIHGIAPDTPLRGHYAGFVSRLLAFLIDLLVMVTVQFIYVLIVRLVFNFLGFSSISDSLGPTNEEVSTSPLILLITWTVAFLSSVTFFSLYVALSWTLIDRTLGQAFIGLRVLRTNGDNLTFWRSLKRAVGYFLAALPLFLGFLWILIDDRRQGWHDKFADTVVIYDWDARLGKKVREWLVRQQEARTLTATMPAGPPPPAEEKPE